jgi:dTDP-4-dehydrorhamnose reductase
VTGAGGMLGQDLLRAGDRAGHELVGLTRAELDVTDQAAVEEMIARVAPGAVVNCSGWTDVDGAESHPLQARAVNAAAAGYLAHAAAVAGATLVHISTDYVFDGEPLSDAAGAPRAYLESDQTHPRSVYGESKLAGEREVLAVSPDNVVARTSWLFGCGGRNFAETMLGLGSDRSAVQVVVDQVGCPTWTGHLAPALIGLIERRVGGLVHLAGAGSVSWHGFALEIFRQAELDCRVEEITTAQMARPAPRPKWSALESERADVLPLPPWQDGLAGFLASRAGLMRV